MRFHSEFRRYDRVGLLRRSLRFHRWLAEGVLLLSFVVSASAAPVQRVESIGLTVRDVDRELEFYTRVLSFEKTSESVSQRGVSGALMNVIGTQLRTVGLRLGEERILLTQHLDKPGRPIPTDSRSFDHWFQHLAIVVSDMDRAYAHLRQAGVKHVSTGPQTLPVWNREAGGIRAFYFRDPEEHVLELIWFPPGKGDPRWQQPASRLFLGIDHTAIVVADTDRSLAFYRDRLGLRVAGTAENYGVEQEHLNQVFGARLRITALRADRGPGIELLEYLTPPGGRALPGDARANDLIFWHTQLRVDDLHPLLRTLRGDGLSFVSRDRGSNRASSAKHPSEFLVRDPDGHAMHLLQEPPPSVGRTLHP